MRLAVAAVLALAAAKAVAAPPQAPPGDRVLVVGTKDAPPFAMKDGSGAWSGFSIELWREVAARLHLRYRLQEATLDGLLDGVADGSLDAGVAALTVTAEREARLDFTQPFYSTGLGIAVPRTVAFDWWRLIRSLVSAGFFEALLGLAGVTLAVGGVVWLLERRHTEHFGRGRTGLVSSVWWSALTMTQAGPEQAPMTAAGRIVAVAWMAASVTIIAVFTAGVTSQLTAKQLQGAVHEVNDLRAVRAGGVEGSASLAYLTHERIPYVVYPSVLAGMEALRAGRLDALVHDRPLLAWLAKEQFGDSVDVLDVTFDRQSYAIALPDGSALRSPINRTMLGLIESEQFQDLRAKYLGRR